MWVGGTEAEREASTLSALLVGLGSISPLADVSLFVNDEIAHPAHDLSLDVPIRASDLLASGEAVDGSAESAIVLANFRTR